MLNRDAFPWPEWQPRLIRLADEGFSISQIARILSREADRQVSRGAVMGRMWRTGVKSRNPVGMERPPDVGAEAAVP